MSMVKSVSNWHIAGTSVHPTQQIHGLWWSFNLLSIKFCPADAAVFSFVPLPSQIWRRTFPPWSLLQPSFLDGLKILALFRNIAAKVSDAPRNQPLPFSTLLWRSFDWCDDQHLVSIVQVRLARWKCEVFISLPKTESFWHWKMQCPDILPALKLYVRLWSILLGYQVRLSYLRL